MMMDRFFDAFNVRDLSEGRGPESRCGLHISQKKTGGLRYLCEFVLYYLYVMSVKRTNKNARVYITQNSSLVNKNTKQVFLFVLCMGACLQWLKTAFLVYLEEWEKEVNAKVKEGNSASERAKMSLSKETIDGLRMTGRYKYIYMILFFAYPLHGYKYICIHEYALCVYYTCRVVCDFFFSGILSGGGTNATDQRHEVCTNRTLFTGSC